MKKIIVISGKQYSGKDTVAKLLIEKLKDFKRVGIGDAIKIEYGKRNNLTFDEIEANKHLYRNDLINLGNEGRAIDPNYWLYKLLEMRENIIVPDIRVEHEIEIFKSEGAYLLRVDATKEARSKRGKITNEFDLTETALDDYEFFNYRLDNSSGMEKLSEDIIPLIKSIKEFFNI